MQKIITKRVLAIALSTLLSGLVVTNVAAADVAKLAEGCDDCHGKDGASSDAHVPIIGGMSKQYMLDSMAAYVAKDRTCADYEYEQGPNKGKKANMCDIADDLSEDETKALAKHYAAKPFVRAKQPFDTALAEKGKAVHDELCEKCHSKAGSLASDDAGILAGQWIPYQEITYKDYASDDRKQPKKMKIKMKKLDAETTKQLIHYYASFQ